jgi:chitinase
MPTVAITPPRLVTYFSSGAIPLTKLQTLPYTDVIFAFVVPTSPTDPTLMGAGGVFGAPSGPDPYLQQNVKTVQSYGKNVLLSFGGSTVASSSYESYASDVDSLVQHLLEDWIIPYGFDGIDIDFEDSSAFTSAGTYSGVSFLTALTNGLARDLPGLIITHAPQTPYWDPGAQYGNAYTQVWNNTAGAITWINNQFYDNPPWDGTPALQEQWYQAIAETTGPSKLMLGELLGGPMSVQQVIQIIQDLRQQYGASLGGAMGWEFATDTNGAWGTSIGGALGLGTAASVAEVTSPSICQP